MRDITLLTLLICLALNLSAEGTRQVAPNGSITIDGTTTTDIAALHIDNVSYNSFMQYDNPDTTSRLYIRITDPGAECIYLGFSPGHLNQTTPTPPPVTFEYRIKDPNGNVVFGPFIVSPADANISGWNDAFAGPSEIFGTSGYNAITVTGADLMSQGWSGQGDFYIEARDIGGQPFLIDFWDITVADCSGTFPEEKPGRIWSYNWAMFAINDFGFPERPFNGAFYVCAPDPDNADAAFVTKIDFDGAGFRPAAFNVAFNSFGAMNTGNVVEDRKSVEDFNSTQAEYAIFLNDPVEFCETAIPGIIELLGVTRCSPDDYCIKVISTKIGQVDLLLDFDGQDGMYTPGSADLLITTIIEPGEVNNPTCIDWDGLDGLGNPIAESSNAPIPVIVSYAQGIYHFPIYDAEFMTNGFLVEAVRPAGDTPLLFYDDSNISVASGSGEPSVQLSGCDIPCHRWTVFNDPAVPGFGNLNTINSWWFAQQIVEEEVFVIPAYYECMVLGEPEICTGETGVLSWEGVIQPTGADAPEVASISWTGPDIIGTPEGSMIEVGAGGLYQVNVVYLTPLGDSCFTSCEFEVTEFSTSMTEIDTTIGYRDTLVINGEAYDESGEYVQVLVNANGCDSVLVIRLNVPETITEWDLNLCESRFGDGTSEDYSEFQPQVFQADCGIVEASLVYREEPATHSCTPGIEGSIAMCVGATDTCAYNADDPNAVIFEITVLPDSGSMIRLTNFSFFEKAPEMYDWIDGASGPNNWPTLYGLRIFRNGEEQYRISDVPTGQEWSLQDYDFSDIDGLIAEEQSTFRFELIGYCVVGNAAQVMAWDLDQLSVQAVCEPVPPTEGLIAGRIRSVHGMSLEGVEVSLTNAASEIIEVNYSNEDGWYEHPTGKIGFDNYLTATDTRNPLMGVTVFDLLEMRKHMLGISQFQYAWQYIAADINLDNRISPSDIVDLRKVMLMSDPQLAHGRSWRFGQWSSAEPFDFDDEVVVENFTGEYTDADFIGVKLGDVNGTINSFQGEIDIIWEVVDYPREFAMASLIINDELEGLQAEFVIDGIIQHAESLSPDCDISYNSSELRIIWLGDSNISSKRALVEVMIYQPGNPNEVVRLKEDKLAAIAIHSKDQVPVKPALAFNTIGRSYASDFKLSAQPNPFSEEVSLQIEASTSGELILEVYGATGQIITEMNVDVEAGSNTVVLDANRLAGCSGILYCRAVFGGMSSTLKMVKLD